MSPVEELVWKLIRSAVFLLVDDEQESLNNLRDILASTFECSIHTVRDADDLLRLEGSKIDVVFIAESHAAHFDTISGALRTVCGQAPRIVVLTKASTSVATDKLSELVGLLAYPQTQRSVCDAFTTFRLPFRGKNVKPVGFSEALVTAPSL